jgi:hypothetical protein
MKTTKLWSVLVCLPVALMVSACSASQASPGTMAGKTHPGATPKALCQAVGKVDRLVMRRSDAFPLNGFHFSFPAVVVVERVALVKDAAEAVCALPRMPSGIFACPADFGIDYHLTFSAKGRVFETVVVSATGCETVAGLGSTKWVARSPRFWLRLGKSMGLASPTYATFRGAQGDS